MLDQSPLSIIARVCRDHFKAITDDTLSDQEANAAQAALSAKAAETWARPVQSFDDVLIRALLAKELAGTDAVGNLAPPRDDAERAFFQLIEGVIALARRHSIDA